MTVVFYDVENILGGVNRDSFRYFQLDAVHRQVVTSAEVGDILEHRAYCAWSRASTRHLEEKLGELGIRLIDMPRPEKYHKDVRKAVSAMRNLADFYIYMDALHVAYTNEEVDCFVFVSLDKDFAALSGRLHAMGKKAVIFERDFGLPPSVFIPRIPRSVEPGCKTYVKNLIGKYTQKYGYIPSFDKLLRNVLVSCAEDELFYGIVREKGMNISAVYQNMRNSHSQISYKQGGEKHMPRAFAKALEDTEFCVCEQNGLFLLLCRDTLPEDTHPIEWNVPAGGGAAFEG